MNQSKNQIAFILIAIITMACSSTELDEVVPNDNANNDSVPALLEIDEALTFSINMDLEKLTEDQYKLITTVKLDEGAYYASPFSNNTFSGLFNIELNTGEYITVGDTLIESPQSVETHDHFSNGPVNWVKEETNYTQLLTLNATSDFVVKGMVTLVVEPVCSRYEIAFEIASKAGELSISNGMPIVNNF